MTCTFARLMQVCVLLVCMVAFAAQANAAPAPSTDVMTIITAIVLDDAPPAAPTIGVATAGNASASVAFTPGEQGDGTLLQYTADCAGITEAGSASPITVGGLTNGTPVTCKVQTTTSTGISPWSADSNPVTPSATGTGPAAPVIGTAVAGDSSVSVAFTPGAQGSGTLIRYTASCAGTTAYGTSSPITVTGLTNGTAYSCMVRTTTSVGLGPWSALSNAVTPIAPPPTPTIGVAIAGDASISVAFTPGCLGICASKSPLEGSSPADSFTADCGGGHTASGTTSPITVSNLSNGTPYTCRVQAVNSAGSSNWSAWSNSVTPATLPSAPTIGVATAGDASVSVAFTAGALGGGTLVNHTADCGGTSATGTASPIVVTGLINGISTTCKVKTTTTAGTSGWSANSNAVTPIEPAVTYFHNDLSGSPQLATNAAGAVVWKENYRPYGERINNPAGSNANNKLWFAGKPFDAATGLSYMGARYYDPVLGRFVGTDPKGFDEGNIHSFNRYAYANNNPYKFVDPDGKSALVATGVGILAIGGAYYALAPPSKQQEMRESIGRLARAIDSVLHNESASEQPAAGADKPSLLDSKGERHVLDGDATGGGHAPGTGKPGKSEFPSGWSRDKIKGEISDVATDPNSATAPGRKGRTVVTGTRDGVDIQVIVEPSSRDNGRIVTGYPTNMPRNGDGE